MDNPTSTTKPEYTTTTTKRQKHHHHHHHAAEPLLPGLPDDIAHLCLSLVPPSLLYSVCRRWRRLIYAPSFPPFPSLYALLSPTQNHSANPIQFSSFDPISCKWQTLPPPPPLPLQFRHPSFISRNLPVQSVAVSGNLVLLAATADHFLPALPQPLVFNTLSQNWSQAPLLPTPRRWCAAGASRGVVYVASGIGSYYENDVARTIEKWDLRATTDQHRRRRRWEKLANLKDAKFSREAIDAVGWRGKLCMVNVRGDAAKEGIIYDVGGDSWAEMPEGMLAGWRGPAAAMEEETIYVVDESKGRLKRYDHVKDTWVVVVENEVLKGAQQVVAAPGKVCVLCADGGSVAVVDVPAATVLAPARLWMVEIPTGYEAVGIHVLPRLSHSNV